MESFRSPYDGIRFAVKCHPVGLSMTKQSFKEECDINTIMSRYEKSGLISHVQRYNGRYEDVSSGMDYRDAIHCVMAAEEAFMSLPAGVRSRFENDPGKFLDFVKDPANLEEMREMGLAKPVEAAVAAAAPSAAVAAVADKPV